jgi:hypothetical protein
MKNAVIRFNELEANIYRFARSRENIGRITPEPNVGALVLDYTQAEPEQE